MQKTLIPIKSLVLSPQFIEEISQFETIYCLVSGGWHSTASALLLHENGFTNVILLHNTTKLEMETSLVTMQKLANYTGYPLINIDPHLPKGITAGQIIKDSLARIPEVKMDVVNGKYDRSKFKCCYYLKKAPGKQFYKTINKETSVVIMSFAPYESTQRRFRLGELHKWDTYLRLHKKNGSVWHAYPFRDFYSYKIFLPYLESKGFGETKHSGCRICPILIVFDINKTKEDLCRFLQTERMFHKIKKIKKS